VSGTGRYGAIQTVVAELSCGCGVAVGGEVGSSVGSGSAVESIGFASSVEGTGVFIAATGWNGVDVIVAGAEAVDKGKFIFAGG